MFKVFLSVVLSLGAFVFSSRRLPAYEKGEVPQGQPANDIRLRFSEKGKFRILQISDIQDGIFLFPIVKDFLTDIVPETKPDLIVLTGDNFSGCTANTHIHSLDLRLAQHGIDQFMSVFEQYGVPVAVVFGNHDAEKGPTRQEQMQMYMKYACCAAYDEGDAVDGCGNYNLPVYSSSGEKIAYNLWFFDSNMYDKDGNYDFVHENQIAWYQNTSDELKKQNGGNAVPSMMFQHIIVPEIFDALKQTDKKTPHAVRYKKKYYILDESNTKSGVLHEKPCPPEINGGQFEAAVKQGDVVAMFFGHDHVNSFQVEHKGIDLVTTPGLTFFSYGDAGRGARIIDLDEKNLSSYETGIVTFHDLYPENKKAALRFQFCGSENSLAKRIRAFFKYKFFKE